MYHVEHPTPFVQFQYIGYVCSDNLGDDADDDNRPASVTDIRDWIKVDGRVGKPASTYVPANREDPTVTVIYANADDAKTAVENLSSTEYFKDFRYCNRNPQPLHVRKNKKNFKTFFKEK